MMVRIKFSPKVNNFFSNEWKLLITSQAFLFLRRWQPDRKRSKWRCTPTSTKDPSQVLSEGWPCRIGLLIRTNLRTEFGKLLVDDQWFYSLVWEVPFISLSLVAQARVRVVDQNQPQNRVPSRELLNLSVSTIAQSDKIEISLCRCAAQRGAIAMVF